ncbi:MAG TPA: hypothetical protein PKD55_15150, partial [Bellilinea sp.]|nr:hypothetical protein [Bellilinea sp.]
YTADLVNDRLKSAITGVGATMPIVISTPSPASPAVPVEPTAGAQGEDDEVRVVTTEAEMEGYFIVKSIIRPVVESSRIGHRDTQSYFGILLDDNNRKPVCRLHFNREQKYLGILDQDKKETRHPIANLDEIYGFAEALIEATKRVA